MCGVCMETKPTIFEPSHPVHREEGAQGNQPNINEEGEIG